MGSKTISLEDGAYALLKAAKRDGESFSEVVRRLLDKNGRDPMRAMIGLLSPEKGDALLQIVKEHREQDRINTVERHKRFGWE